jgi:hypothetical protein
MRSQEGSKIYLFAFMLNFLVIFAFFADNLSSYKKSLKRKSPL